MNGFDDRGAEGAARLWRELAEAQDTALAAEEHGHAQAGGLTRHAAFAAAHLGRTRSRRRLGRLPLALGLAAGTAILVLVVSSVTHKPTLSVQLGTSAPREEAIPTLVADARNDLPLRFSDGSMVTFQAGSSGQLQRLNSSGAELVLARGALHAHVIHAVTTSWILHAGPYRVRVTGTRFGLSWRSERLDLALYEGSVVVDGAVLGPGVSVRAGQRLTVASGVVRIEPLGSAKTTTVALATPAELGTRGARRDSAEPSRDREGTAAPLESAAGSEPPVTPAPAAEPRMRPATARLSRRSPARVAGDAATDDEWLALAESGAYRQALDVAKRAGLRNLCRRLDARRLLTLGDIARYADAPVPAHRAFEALVKRFPSDRLASDAVFSLGRLAFEAGRPAEAARWFHRYVSDWPKGPLVEQAAGRLLESTIRLQDADAAHAAARAYLARAPHGAQATLARGVLAESADGPAAP